MTNLSLSSGEHILIRSDVSHNNKSSELVLTNRNLFCIEENYGLFKKAPTIIRYSIEQIRVVNGQVQASILKDSDGWVLQIFTNRAIEKFTFECDFFQRTKVKQEVSEWINQLSLLLTGTVNEKINESNESTVADKVRNALASVGIKSEKQESPCVTKKCVGCMAPLSGKAGQRVQCPYCDTEQVL